MQQYGGNCAKLNKSSTERHILHDLIYIGNLKQKAQSCRNRVEGWVETAEWEDRSQRVQNYSYVEKQV